MFNQTESEVVSTVNSPAYRAALADQRPSLMAMPEEEIERKSALDPGAAAVTAEASAKKLEPFRVELVEQFGAQAGTKIDELTPVARATRQADIEYAGTTTSVDVSAMNEGVRTDYHLLITDAEALANRKLIDAKRLDAARDVQGYQALIHSLLVLVFVLRESWPQIKDHTPLSEADLDRVETNALRMSAAVGDRDNKVGCAPAADLRLRAVSKLIHLYEELRRMMSFIRYYQGDVDAIIPSLWAGRGGRGRPQGSTDATSTDMSTDAGEPATPATPSPVNGGGPFVS